MYYIRLETTSRMCPTGGPEGPSNCQTNKECTGESGISSVMAVLCGPRLMIGEADVELDCLTPD